MDFRYIFVLSLFVAMVFSFPQADSSSDEDLDLTARGKKDTGKKHHKGHHLERQYQTESLEEQVRALLEVMTADDDDDDDDDDVSDTDSMDEELYARSDESSDDDDDDLSEYLEARKKKSNKKGKKGGKKDKGRNDKNQRNILLLRGLLDKLDEADAE